VAGSERLRLFCALRLPAGTIRELVAWQEGALVRGRRVPPENLHVTLAFLGSRPASEVPRITEALRASAAGAGGMRLAVRRYSETRGVGMLELADEGGCAAALAGRLHRSLEELGVYEREARPWLPHVTVVRFRKPPKLQPDVSVLGEIVPSDAAVFISRLRPGGAVYEAPEAVPLTGTQLGGG
jgi:2'-5' RNA ligase